MFDLYNRKIDYLRISVTDLCNLRCRYCMPEDGIKKLGHSQILSYEQIIQIARAGVGLGITKIRLTGGEPLVRRDLGFLVAELRKITALKELALTTNGILLEKFASYLKRAGLDRINVSLDTLNPGKYSFITRGGNIEHVFAGIKAAQAAGFGQIKINMVVMEDFNLDEVLAMARFCSDNGLILQRISRYHLQNRKQNAVYHTERPLPCADCNRLRLTADGYLKPCLFSDLEVKVNFQNIEASFLQALEMKPFMGTACSNRRNYQIGG